MSPVCVDQEGEGAKAVSTIAVSVVEGGEGEHEDYLTNTEDNLGDGSTKGGQFLESRALLRAYQELGV